MMSRDEFIAILQPEMRAAAGRLFDYLLEHPEELALPLSLDDHYVRWAQVAGFVTNNWTEPTISFVAGGVAMQLMAEGRLDGLPYVETPGN